MQSGGEPNPWCGNIKAGGISQAWQSSLMSEGSHSTLEPLSWHLSWEEEPHMSVFENEWGLTP